MSHHANTVDEEIGASTSLRSTDRFAENQSAPPPTRAPPKSNAKWLAAATIAVLAVVGIAVAVSGKGGDDAAASSVATPPAPQGVPVDDSIDANYVSDGGPGADPNSPGMNVFVPEGEAVILSSDDVGSGNGAQDTAQFKPEPQVTVGDAAMLALPDVTSAPTARPTDDPSAAPTPSPSSSPTSEPTVASSILPSASLQPTKYPTVSPTASPSASPSGSPSKKPTLAPSISPTKEPTSAPTESPTNPPSTTPTRSPFSLSGWTFSAFGLEPTVSPSEDPTAEPSVSPTKRPTNTPTARPTNTPTKRPTPGPTKTPTRFPTKQPSSNPTNGPSAKPTTDAPTIYEPFFFGDNFVTRDDLGLEVSEGLSVRIIAQEGQSVPYADGGKSNQRYHTMTDAAGIIPMDPENPTESGYAYVVNSEDGDGNGGVYAIYFDKDGNVLEYKDLLTGTTDNCGGGLTPWNTWISCEEFSEGQCWEVDPVAESAKVTKLGGRGGRYESVACDNTNPNNPVFFTTEDDEAGALRRFVADGNGKGVLQSDPVEEHFLNILDGNSYEWTTDLDAARESAVRFYRNSEGIQFHEGRLYFMAKKDLKMIVLNVDDGTYETQTTGKKFYGEGSFGDQPDQNLFGPTRKYQYFTEDGGESPGVYAQYDKDGTFFTLFQAIKGGRYDGDETVGIALSPDNMRFYAGIQMGIIFEFTRDDGLPFE